MFTRVGTPLVAAYLAALILIVVLAIGFFCWFRTLTVLRGIVWLIGHTFYRIRVGGLENVPKTGACLLVCNHVSYIDWLFLVAVQRRLIRFVILKGWTKRWGMRHCLSRTRLKAIRRSSSRVRKNSVR